MVVNSSWMDYAACKGMDSSIFFPNERSLKDVERVKLAKEVCESCSVRDVCGLHAERYKEDMGIWGGLTATERSRGCF